LYEEANFVEKKNANAVHFKICHCMEDWQALITQTILGLEGKDSFIVESREVGSLVLSSNFHFCKISSEKWSNV